MPIPDPSVAAQPGREFRLLVADPATSPPSFVQIAGLRNTQMSLNNNPVDITNVASQGYREWLPDGGVQEMQMTCDGIFELGATGSGSQLLWEAARDRTLIWGRVESGHGDFFEGAFVVQTFQRTGAFDGAETFNATIMSSGPTTYDDGIT